MSIAGWAYIFVMVIGHFACIAQNAKGYGNRGIMGNAWWQRELRVLREQPRSEWVEALPRHSYGSIYNTARALGLTGPSPVMHLRWLRIKHEHFRWREIQERLACR